MKKPLAILFGGTGSERLVSVASAQNVARHLPVATLLLWRRRGDVVVVPHRGLAQHRRPFEEELATESLTIYAGSLEGALGVCAAEPGSS